MWQNKWVGCSVLMPKVNDKDYMGFELIWRNYESLHNTGDENKPYIATYT